MVNFCELLWNTFEETLCLLEFQPDFVDGHCSYHSFISLPFVASLTFVSTIIHSYWKSSDTDFTLELHLL